MLSPRLDIETLFGGRVLIWTLSPHLDVNIQSTYQALAFRSVHAAADNMQRFKPHVTHDVTGRTATRHENDINKNEPVVQALHY